ncbi:unnamed protein product [Larinioides sclopetarius]|uniref:Uncharacterized protein n=1 Tax=Larinioides sclopetarius TaxID=280406 RepID=A0AAV2BQ99_9ARAC
MQQKLFSEMSFESTFSYTHE